MSPRVLPVGKLPNALLGRLLRRYVRLDPRVRLGPGVGEDACAIDVGRRLLVAKTDPVTLVAEDIARYALIVNSNDIATRGAEPKWFLGTLLLPDGKTTPSDAERHFRQLSEACRELGVSMVGGHAEVTAGLDRPIIAGFLLGTVDEAKLLATKDARPGDDLILTKGAAIEAVSVLARAKAAELARRYPAGFIRRCRNFIRKLSILPEARIARDAGARAMHDPTEGGLATALHEIAAAAGVGVRAQADAIFVSPEARELCRLFGLDPLGAIASGALVVAVEPRRSPSLLSRLRRARIPAWRIGACTRERGVWLVSGGRRRRMPSFARDEIARVI